MLLVHRYKRLQEVKGEKLVEVKCLEIMEIRRVSSWGCVGALWCLRHLKSAPQFAFKL